MSPSPKKNKPARWEFLDELDGCTVDHTPVRSLYRKPAVWEWILYGLAALLWIATLWAVAMEQVGATGLTVLGVCVLCLRLTVYEAKRRKRCKGALLGTVESVTRRPHIRKNARYPVIRFEVDGATYYAYGTKPVHPATIGNEEWIGYNPQDPADCYVTANSRFKAALLLTAIMGFLGVAFLILEMS